MKWSAHLQVSPFRPIFNVNIEFRKLKLKLKLNHTSSLRFFQFKFLALSNNHNQLLLMAFHYSNPHSTYNPYYYVRLLENHEKFELLVSGYIRLLPFLIPTDILNIINYYALPLPKRSMNHIAATHFVAKIINDWVTDAMEKCENFQEASVNSNNNNNKMHTHDDEFNMLKYIYVKGGALRDCHLLRNIKDIDIVVDIHQLTKLHLSHLQKYHNDGNVDSNCPFWKHFLNKFHYYGFLYSYGGIINRRIQRYTRGRRTRITKEILPNNKIAAKLFRYEDFIVRSDYLFNVKFIVETVLQRAPKYRYNIRSSTQWYDRNYVVTIKDVHYKGMCVIGYYN